MATITEVGGPASWRVSPASIWRHPLDARAELLTAVAQPDGRWRANYGPDYIRSAQHIPGVPPLRPDQVAAMAELDRLADDPRFVLTMDLRPGDMQFLNNHVVMHSRTSYEDHAEPGRRRDLIRVWINELPNAVGG
jgi:hypothetical protein